jgi:hypothetical protein
MSFAGIGTSIYDRRGVEMVAMIKKWSVVGTRGERRRERTELKTPTILRNDYLVVPGEVFRTTVEALVT